MTRPRQAEESSRRDRKDRAGENHWAWTGDDATYDAAHQRVRAERGRPSGYQCTDCDTQAYHWSYDHSDPAERVDGRGLRYSLDVNHYVPRCVSCHKRFDCTLLIQERGGTLNESPRCGKPITHRLALRQVSDPTSQPICARAAGHTTRCSPPETYQRELEQVRKKNLEIAPGVRQQPSGPAPRCDEPMQLPKDKESDVCGRPAGHSGGHIGSRSYRRSIERSSATHKELRRQRKAA